MWESSRKKQRKTNTSWRWRRLCDSDESSAFQMLTSFFVASSGACAIVSIIGIALCLFIESCAHAHIEMAVLFVGNTKNTRISFVMRANKLVLQWFSRHFYFKFTHFFSVVFANVAALCCDWAGQSGWNGAEHRLIYWERNKFDYSFGFYACCFSARLQWIIIVIIIERII